MQAMGSSLNARIVAEATGIRGGTSSLDRLLHQSPAAVAEAMPASSYRRPGPSVMYSSPLDDARALLSEERSRPYSPSARFASGGSGSGSFAAAAQAQRSLMGGASRVRGGCNISADDVRVGGRTSRGRACARRRAHQAHARRAGRGRAPRRAAQRHAQGLPCDARGVAGRIRAELRFAAVVIGRASAHAEDSRGHRAGEDVNQMRRKALFAMLHLCTRRAMTLARVLRSARASRLPAPAVVSISSASCGAA